MNQLKNIEQDNYYLINFNFFYVVMVYPINLVNKQLQKYKKLVKLGQKFGTFNICFRTFNIIIFYILYILLIYCLNIKNYFIIFLNLKSMVHYNKHYLYGGKKGNFFYANVFTSNPSINDTVVKISNNTINGHIRDQYLILNRVLKIHESHIHSGVLKRSILGDEYHEKYKEILKQESTAVYEIENLPGLSKETEILEIGQDENDIRSIDPSIFK